MSILATYTSLLNGDTSSGYDFPESFSPSAKSYPVDLHLAYFARVLCNAETSSDTSVPGNGWLLDATQHGYAPVARLIETKRTREGSVGIQRLRSYKGN